jgi:hypothetical protein
MNSPLLTLAQSLTSKGQTKGRHKGKGVMMDSPHPPSTAILKERSLPSPRGLPSVLPIRVTSRPGIRAK